MSNEALEVFCWFLCVICFGLFWAVIILGSIVSDIKKQIDYLYEELRRRNKNND